MKRKAICAGTLVATVIMAIAWNVIRFQNPDMTDMRLIITYRPLFVASVINAIILGLCVTRM